MWPVTAEHSTGSAHSSPHSARVYTCACIALSGVEGCSLLLSLLPTSKQSGMYIMGSAASEACLTDGVTHRHTHTDHRDKVSLLTQTYTTSLGIRARPGGNVLSCPLPQGLTRKQL